VNKKLIINFYGGPGSGKSTSATALFSQLKFMDINCEYVSEYAKDLTWAKRHNELDNQIYIFGKQYHKMHRLKEVDIIVTDSPLLLSLIYSKGYPFYDELKALVLKVNKSFDNINIFLNRTKKYNPSGRNQTAEESIQIDRDILELLEINTRMNDLYTFNGDVDIAKNIINHSEIKEKIAQHKNKY